MWHKAKKCHLTPGQTELKVWNVEVKVFIVSIFNLMSTGLFLLRDFYNFFSYFQVDFPLPIVASNLMIEYADFYENFQVHSLY